MRLDKFLKVSRIIKRRTVANNACDSEHVKVNGKEVKASYNVKIGDIIEVSFGERILKVQVKDIKEHILKNTRLVNNLRDLLSSVCHVHALGFPQPCPKVPPPGQEDNTCAWAAKCWVGRISAQERSRQRSRSSEGRESGRAVGI